MWKELTMTAYIICDNDATLHVVIGDDNDPEADNRYAECVKDKLKNGQIEKYKKNYGEHWEEYFSPRFFHIHRESCEVIPGDVD